MEEDDDDDNDDDGRIGVRNEGNESVAENAKLSSIGKSWNERERETMRELWKRQRNEKTARNDDEREREERTQQKRARGRNGTWIYPPSPSPSHCLSVDPWDPPDWLHDDPTLPSSRPCYLHTLTSFTDFHGQTEASRGHRTSHSRSTFFAVSVSTRKPSLYIVYRSVGLCNDTDLKIFKPCNCLNFSIDWAFGKKTHSEIWNILQIILMLHTFFHH